MTSFATLEASRESSRPLEIYEILIGNDEYRYTSGPSDLTVGASIYTATAISRNAIEQGSDSQARNLVLTLPGDNAFAARYRNIVPGQRATVNVWRLQRDESPSFNTRILLYKGQVMSVRFPQDGYTAEIAVRSIEQALNRSIPRYTFMGMCNHILYSPACGADPLLHDVVGTVSAVSGNTITLPGANAKPDGFYNGGYCRPLSGDDDFRMILSHVGNVLTLLLPFAEDVNGAQVQAFAGCDHLVDGDCATVHDRVAEFGGFPFVPNKNVFQTGLD
jgi:hypothetical protein